MRNLLSFSTSLLIRFKHDEKAATAIEYGLFVALIAVAMIVGMDAFSSSMIDMFGTVDDKLDSVSGGSSATSAG